MTENQLILKDRRELTVTGVTDVNAFNEESIVLSMEGCSLIIKGENLHINNLNLEQFRADIDGKVNSMQYISENTDKGFLKRLLR